MQTQRITQIPIQKILTDQGFVWSSVVESIKKGIIHGDEILPIEVVRIEEALREYELSRFSQHFGKYLIHNGNNTARAYFELGKLVVPVKICLADSLRHNGEYPVVRVGGDPRLEHIWEIGTLPGVEALEQRMKLGFYRGLD